MLKIKNKIVVVILLLLLVLGLSSCSNREKQVTYIVNGKVFSVVTANVANPISYRNTTGCTFLGWYTDDACQTRYEDYDKTLEDDLTLYGVSLSYFDILKNYIYLNNPDTLEYVLYDSDFRIVLSIVEKEELCISYNYENTTIMPTYQRTINYYPESNKLIQDYHTTTVLNNTKIESTYIVNERYEKNVFNYSLSKDSYTYTPNDIITSQQRKLQQLSNEAAYNILNTIFYQCNNLIKDVWSTKGENFKVAIPSFVKCNSYSNLERLENIKERMLFVDLEVSEINEFVNYTGEGFNRGYVGIYEVNNEIKKYLMVLEFDNEQNAELCSIRSDQYYGKLLEDNHFFSDPIVEFNDNYVYIYTSNAEYIKR